LNGLANRLAKFVRDLEERVDTLSNQRDNFKSLLAKSLEQIEVAESEAESASAELQATEKRLDRSQSAYVQSLSAGGLGGKLESATESKKEDLSHHSTATTPTNTTEAATIRPDTVEVSDKTIDQAIMEQITENQMLVSFRQKELEALNAERQQLRQEFDQLSARVANIPIDSLVDTAYYKNLQSSYELFQDKCDALEQRISQLSRECETCRSDIRVLEDQVRQSNSVSKAAMETEIRRLDGDLARIKKTRDHSQALLDQIQSREDSAATIFNDQLNLLETGKVILITMCVNWR
jgi:E3 ubiquitin-protein ligase BRE1